MSTTLAMPLQEHPQYAGYFATGDGYAYSGWTRGKSTADPRSRKEVPRLVRPYTNKLGYSTVIVCKGGVRKYMYLHRFVWECHRGACPRGLVVRHLDGNPRNNRLDNLQLGTWQDNSDDRRRHGTNCGGEDHPQHKLQVANVLLIREEAARGVRAVVLAQKFGVSRQAIHGVISRRNWGHL